MNKTSGRTFIHIRYRILAVMAYCFLIIPIYIFFLGWLKMVLGILMSLLLTIGFVFLIQKEYPKNEQFQIELCGLIVIAAVSGLWVYTSGVGGFWIQREDWHWRNALLRDLINYSWPIIYPKTGNALVYYFNYFLPPALIGKLLGWDAANVALALFTWLGICISMLLICKTLKLQSLKQVLVLVIVFVIWSGLFMAWDLFLRMYGLSNHYGFQYSSNNTLLQWVTNQTMAPWIAIPLFLDKRKVSTYVFLGLCVFASAPLPFIGLFVIMAIDGLIQIKKSYKEKNPSWFNDIRSIPNLCAILSIFPVYACFFICNSAASGNAGAGGFHLLIPPAEFSIGTFIVFLSFLFFHFIIYTLPIFKLYRNDSLFLTINISLLLIPLFQLGTGNDFGMRVCIPAQFVLMIYILSYIIYQMDSARKPRNLIILSCLALTAFSFCSEWMDQRDRTFNALYNSTLLKDSIHSFSNKTCSGDYCGMPLYNFLYENPETSLFFTKFSKEKSEDQSIRDLAVLEAYLENFDYCLCSGHYMLSPTTDGNYYLQADENTLSIGNEQTDFYISNSVTPGKYEIYLLQNDSVWEFNSSNKAVSFCSNAGRQKWGNPNVDESQLFEIRKSADGYTILWNGEYALEYTDGVLCWKESVEDNFPMWRIVPIPK